jgi:hypothetical protein
VANVNILLLNFSKEESGWSVFMVEEIARLYYETDVVSVKPGVLDLNFPNLFAWPKRLLELCEHAFTLLDEYAIDGLCSVDEFLPFTACCASRLDLPFFWLRDGKLVGGKKQQIKRLMFVSALTPSAENMETISQFFASQSIELVGIFSFLGFDRRNPPTRLISLVECKQVLAIFRDLYLLSGEEYERISLMLSSGPQSSEN